MHDADGTARREFRRGFRIHPAERVLLVDDILTTGGSLLAMLPVGDALLLLRADGLSYDETAAALNLNPSSVGTLLARARQAFRKEYVKRYGEQ